MNYDELYKTLNQQVSVFIKPTVAFDGVVEVRRKPLTYLVVGNLLLALVLIIASPEFLMTKTQSDDGEPVLVRSWGKLVGAIVFFAAISFWAYLRTT